MAIGHSLAKRSRGGAPRWAAAAGQIAGAVGRSLLRHGMNRLLGHAEGQQVGNPVSKYHEDEVMYNKKRKRISGRKRRRFRKAKKRFDLSLLRGVNSSSTMKDYTAVITNTAGTISAGGTARQGLFIPLLFSFNGDTSNNDMLAIAYGNTQHTEVTNTESLDYTGIRKRLFIQSGVQDLFMVNTHATNGATIDMFYFQVRKAINVASMSSFITSLPAGGYVNTQNFYNLCGWTPFADPAIGHSLKITRHRRVILAAGERFQEQIRVKKNKWFDCETLEANTASANLCGRPGWTQGVLILVNGQITNTAGNVTMLATEVSIWNKNTYTWKYANHFAPQLSRA